MELETISGAATVAVTSTVAFLLVAKTWNRVARTVSSAPSFPERSLHESAQRFRDELERLSQSQGIYFCGILVFMTLFAAGYLLEADHLFAGYPSWQLYLQLSFMLLVAAFAAYFLVKTIMIRRQLQFVRDANIAIGHQLQQMTVAGTRVFHDVATSAGVVDHVVVGRQGLSAVNVIAKRARNGAEARLDGDRLEFSNGEDGFSIAAIAAKTAGLQEELSQLLGRELRVRSVIAMPGWAIGEQSGEDHLLVNERTLTMLNGWKHSSDHLMNEDADALQHELTARCARA